MWETSDGSGSAVWLDAAMTATFTEDELVTRPLIALITDDGGARYSRFWDWLDTHLPDEPAWFLDQIGVDPAHQGSGIGGALISHGLAMADAAGLPAILETGNARNVPFYQRCGFRIDEEADAPDGGPHIWFMRRDPRTPADIS